MKKVEKAETASVYCGDYQHTTFNWFANGYGCKQYPSVWLDSDCAARPKKCSFCLEGAAPGTLPAWLMPKVNAVHGRG